MAFLFKLLLIYFFLFSEFKALERGLTFRRQKSRYEKDISHENFHKYENIPLDNLLLKDPDTIVSAVKDQKIAVYDLKRLATPEKYLNEVIIFCVINTFASLPDHKFVVSQYLSNDLKEGKSVLQRYKAEYRMYFDGHDLIIVPLCLGAHWTLAIIYPKSKEIEFYDSFHYKQKPNSLFESCKDYMEEILETKLSVSIRKDLPHQQNYTDCGMYVCKFAEHAISGIGLNFSDNDMNGFRLDYANKVRELKTDLPKFLEPRKIDERSYDDIDEKTDDIDEKTDDIDEKTDDIDENEKTDSNEAVYKTEMKTEVHQSLCRFLYRSSLNHSNNFGILLFEESIVLAANTDRPFLGKDKNGKIITYNTKGDWTKMLSFVEILNHFEQTDHDKAFVLVTNEILQNHSIIHDWCANSRNPGEEISHFQFHWGLTNNFNKLKKIMKSQGVILQDKMKRDKNFLKKQKKLKKKG